MTVGGPKGFCGKAARAEEGSGRAKSRWAALRLVGGQWACPRGRRCYCSLAAIIQTPVLFSSLSAEGDTWAELLPASSQDLVLRRDQSRQRDRPAPGPAWGGNGRPVFFLAAA